MKKKSETVELEEFPDVVFAVRTVLGLHYFTDIKHCPVPYTDQIEIRIYHRGNPKILKKTYEVLEISSSTKDEDVK